MILQQATNISGIFLFSADITPCIKTTPRIPTQSARMKLGGEQSMCLVREEGGLK